MEAGRTVDWQHEMDIGDARSSLRAQAAALNALSVQINDDFSGAINLILESHGRLVISGMGKSGHVSRKIAASLASTGTRAFFVHPGEAFHGDLGMITPEDVVLLISNSGETDEVIKLIPALQRSGNKIIGMHGNMESTLAKHADVSLLVKVEREICPHNLAPTTSTLDAMAMGDALTVALMKQRHFLPEDFAQYHLGCSLGRRLLTRVSDLMHSKNLPLVESEKLVRDCLFVMTKSRLVLVMEGEELVGILTDGDLRRALLVDSGMMKHPVIDFMSRGPVTIHKDTGEGYNRQYINYYVSACHWRTELRCILDPSGSVGSRRFLRAERHRCRMFRCAGKTALTFCCTKHGC